MSAPQPVALDVKTTTVRGRGVVKVRGDVDMRSSPGLRDQLLEAAQALSGELLIDLSEVDYIDSSGVGTMVYVKREVERAGGHVVLIGLRPRVRGVFEMTRLDTFFKIVPSVAEAGNP
jgi:anti-anti-sigma factor